MGEMGTGDVALRGPSLAFGTAKPDAPAAAPCFEEVLVLIRKRDAEA
jgi:hypothetical protein